MSEPAPRDPVEWSISAACRHGETTSGDLAVVNVLQEGALVAGIDGLGHGSEAARAARLAAQAIREGPADDLILLAHRCHEVLQGTRGAALSLVYVSIRTDEITWLGVGSVEGRLLTGGPVAPRLVASLALARGVAGHELPAIRTETLKVNTGDLLLLATDGIRDTFADSLDIAGPTEAITERILVDDWNHQDDALVVAVRYLGPRS